MHIEKPGKPAPVVDAVIHFEQPARCPGLDVMETIAANRLRPDGDSILKFAEIRRKLR